MKMLSTEVLAQFEIAVNAALALPREHGFGSHFVSRYIDEPVAYKVDPEWMGAYSLPSMDYASMSKWAWELGSMSAARGEPPEQIRLTESQHQILVDFLTTIEVLSGEPPSSDET